jgi:hypothetical protein
MSFKNVSYMTQGLTVLPEPKSLYRSLCDRNLDDGVEKIFLIYVGIEEALLLLLIPVLNICIICIVHLCSVSNGQQVDTVTLLKAPWKGNYTNNPNPT